MSPPLPLSSPALLGFMFRLTLHTHLTLLLLLLRPPPIIDILTRVSEFPNIYFAGLNELNQYELMNQGTFLNSGLGVEQLVSYMYAEAFSPLCLPKPQLKKHRFGEWGDDCEWSHVVVLWDRIRLSVRTRTHRPRHVHTDTHTHTSVSQPPAQMLISTAVFLCVWTSFMMMLQNANQTSLQWETWGGHTCTLIQAQMSLHLYSSNVDVCVCS